MREPSFWYVQEKWSRDAAPVARMLLTPISALYQFVTTHKLNTAKGFHADIPVICVGNLTVGGVGKTPLTLMLRKRIKERLNKRVATLSRGYGGDNKGPLKVDPDAHSADIVGDEPLMMAHTGESWIGRDRADAARAMIDHGVEIILMDDGFQNPSLVKTCSIVVIDARDAFGNGFVFPKGPLREPVAVGLLRADLVVMMGDGDVPSGVINSDVRTIRAHVAAIEGPKPGRYVGFAGIGKPEKFFDTLTSFDGVLLEEGVPYPDHHKYSQGDLDFLKSLATERQAQLITTEKDFARLSTVQREGIETLPVVAEIRDPMHDQILNELIDSIASAM